MFDYVHKTSSRSKSLKIKIEQSGKVIVVSPKYVPRFVVEKFVKQHQDWIEKTLKKYVSQNKFDSNEFTYIFGKKYQRKVEFSNSKKTGVFVSGGKLVFNPLSDPTDETKTSLNKKFQKKIDDFLKNTAGHYIIQRVHELGKKMDLKFNRISLKKQKTRWGSCSSQRNLNFNWKLVHFDTKIIDYVIIHELSHLVHMDHSKNFWALVRKYDPEYLKHRGWLKRNGLNLD